VMYEANQRVGTACAKTRGEVRGTTKKPWRQKGTGRARAGTKKSPIWRGGGITHGPRPRDYSYSLPRKALRVALRTALLGKLRDGEVSFIDEIGLDAPRTREVAKALGALGATGRTTLVVLPEANEVAWKSGRNVRGTDVRVAAEVTAHDVLRYRTVVMVGEALERLKERVA